jgi:hypothetical protein
VDHYVRSNWRSVWVKRPDYHARTVRAVNGVHVDACVDPCLWPDRAVKWAIRSGENSCLDKGGDCSIEQLRPDATRGSFLRRFHERRRFGALEVAYAIAVSWLEQHVEEVR